MGRIALKERLGRGIFVLDGAMGTQLIARGAEAGKCNELLNVESPEIVLGVHKAYIEAGGDAVITNTFGANKYTLGRHGLGGDVARLCKAGAEVARQAAGEDRYVLGDIGPSGDFLEPLGTLKAEDLKAAFVEQAMALVEAGVDGLIVETMTAIDEVEVAVSAAAAVAGDKPVFASMSFDAAAGGGFRTMMGVDVETAVAKIVSLGVDAVGFNCGTATLEQYVELAERFVGAVEAASSEVHVLAEPNAGKPELVDDQAVYSVTGEQFAAAEKKMAESGVKILGGCCGTGPEHIGAVAKLLKAP